MSRPRLALSAAVALGLAAGGTAGPARGLDLDGVGGLDTQTVASRDRLRFYDNSKKYGAMRVADRSRNDYAPDGIRVGNYVVFPSLQETVTFDDNLFATSTARSADLISALEPTLRLQSRFARHALDFSVGARIVNHARNTELDHMNGHAQVSGSLHVDHAHTLAALVFSGIDHELPSDPGVPLGAGRPVEIWRNRASIGFTRDVGRLYGTLSGTVESLDYQDTVSRGGQLLDQDSRDTTTTSAELRMGFRLSPGYEVVGKLRGLRQINRGTAELDRDGYGYEAMAGIAAELDPLLRWRLLGGWGMRDYDQAGMSSVASSLLEGQITWLPTEQVTLYLTARRAISDTVDLDGAGRIDTSIKGRLEYEIWRNLVLTGSVELRQSEFSGQSREDQTYTAAAGVEYWLNKNVMFTFAYEHQERHSTWDAFDFTRNKVSVGAKLRF